jgi:hypothetical protein
MMPAIPGTCFIHVDPIPREISLGRPRTLTIVNSPPFEM